MIKTQSHKQTNTQGENIITTLTRVINIITSLTRVINIITSLTRVMITAEHLPGFQNQTADLQSREYRDSSNWKLAVPMFRAIATALGPLEVDLFADQMNRQLEKYVSWKPDPGAWMTGAFAVKRRDLKACAFPHSQLALFDVVTPLLSCSIAYLYLESSCLIARVR